MVSGQWPPLKNGHHSVVANDEVSVIMNLMKVEDEDEEMCVFYFDSCHFHEIHDDTDLISGRH